MKSNPRKNPRKPESLDRGASGEQQSPESDSSFERIERAITLSAHPVSTSALDVALRRYGVEGEESFLALAGRYLLLRGVEASRTTFFPLERATAILDGLARDRNVLSLLDKIVEADPHGLELPVWYQFFLGRRFREGSGKFFTPRLIAGCMANLLPVTPNAVVMDPTCGGGTFLPQASKFWSGVPCKLVGNDVDKMLVGLTEIVLALSLPPEHSIDLKCANLFDCGNDFRDYWHSVDCILANPPFSLPLERVGMESQLFRLGYKNSDAIFLDVCLRLLKPGGTLVCLLPHSVIVNSDYQKLRLAIEHDWDLCGIITLPEGVFYLTANTTTRADIVHLRKKNAKRKGTTHLYFANAPSVGIPLNSRMANFGENSLAMIVSDIRLEQNERLQAPSK